MMRLSPFAVQPADNEDGLQWPSIVHIDADIESASRMERLLLDHVGALHVAHCAERGLRLLCTVKPQLLLIRVPLAAVDTAVLLQRIQRLQPELSVLVLTTAEAPDVVAVTTTLERVWLLQEPIQTERLLATIAQCLQCCEQIDHLRLFPRLFMNSPLAMAITDSQRNFIRVNPAFTQITGYTQAEVLGRNPRILSSGKHDGEFYRRMWQILEENDHWCGEIWNRHKDGQLFLEWLNITTLRNADGSISHYVSIFADITQRTAAEAKMRHLAQHDCLTDLPNRSLLHDRLHQALLQAQRSHGLVALVYIDIDHFKNINDCFGHVVGDGLIVNVANALRSVIRETDTVSRLGGDEFAVLLPDVGSLAVAEKLVGKLLNAVANTYQIDGHDFRVTASMGVSVFPYDGREPDTLIRHADSALYLAKNEGRNQYRFFDPVLETHTERYTTIQHNMHKALQANAFRIHFQPKYAMDSQTIVGLEALLRWQDEKLGPVSPGEFIPIAEQTGFIVELGVWLIETVCLTMAQWRASATPLVPVAVNISPLQFHRGDLQVVLSQALARHGIEPALLQVELTEGVVMNRHEPTIIALNRIKALGVAISIDDFGTGYSSLSYLSELPVDELKIDRSFIVKLAEPQHLADKRLTAVPLALIDLAANLGLKLVAEGVETDIQADFLLANGCHVIQGYWFSKPLVAEAVPDVLKRYVGKPSNDT
ncbi:MAG: EAL domain-containing protein [Methylomonas sp.]|nr:EAL domain-containing protein [Methylomonas sp.]